VGSRWDDRSIRARARRRARRLFLRVTQPLTLRTIDQAAAYRFDGLRLYVPRGVFHPGRFFSTRFVADRVLGLELTGRRFVEVGCGSGLIAVAAARRGALVTALDISKPAVDSAVANGYRNGVVVEGIVSDLFDALGTERVFDIVLITPPYFRKDPDSVEDHAWFAGANFEYYRNLFAQLADRITPDTLALMGQGEDCDLDEIERLAAACGLRMDLWADGVRWLDRQYLFRYTRTG
jgi:release factor glutamine methyltransferase